MHGKILIVIRCLSKLLMDDDEINYDLIEEEEILLEASHMGLSNLSSSISYTERENLHVVNELKGHELYMFTNIHSSGSGGAYSETSLEMDAPHAKTMDPWSTSKGFDCFQSNAIKSMHENRVFNNTSRVPPQNLLLNLQDPEDGKKQPSKVGILANECIELVKRNRLQNEMECRADPNASYTTFTVLPVKKRKVRSNPREWRILYHNLTKDQCIQYLKYHRWKEPVTNAPKGTGCRVSQCAIHSGCNHLLKMR